MNMDVNLVQVITNVLSDSRVGTNLNFKIISAENNKGNQEKNA